MAKLALQLAGTFADEDLVTVARAWYGPGMEKAISVALAVTVCRSYQARPA